MLFPLCFQHNFSSNQKEKETSLYLCANLGIKPPTLFSGHCLTIRKIMLLKLDTTLWVAVPPLLFFAISFVPDSTTWEKKRCFHHILSHCKKRNSLHYCIAQKTSSACLDSCWPVCAALENENKTWCTLRTKLLQVQLWRGGRGGREIKVPSLWKTQPLFKSHPASTSVRREKWTVISL